MTVNNQSRTLVERWFRAFMLVAIAVVAPSCGGGGGGGGSPPLPPVNTVSGQVSVPGTTATGPAAFKAGSPTQPATPAQQKLEVLIVWKDSATQQGRENVISSFGLKAESSLGKLLSYSVVTATNAVDLASLLKARPEVSEASVQAPSKAHLLPTDPFFAPYQWDLFAMFMPNAWNITTGSASVIVAVVDTGIDTAHAELSGRFVAGYDFVTDPVNAADGDGRDPNPQPGTLAAPGTKEAHGTHVAGTIAANANGTGLVGVDWACKIMPVRVLGATGQGAILDIWEGLIFAADLQDVDLSSFSWFPSLYPTGLNPARPRPAAPAWVINMSLAANIPKGNLATTVYRDLFIAVRAKGIVVVVAAGNENAPIDDGVTEKWPAKSADVITVSAYEKGYGIAPYSNFGAEVDVAAPGGNTSQNVASFPQSGGILSTVPGDVAFFQGTSMAAPHVTGTVSLLFAVNPSFTWDDIYAIVTLSASDLGVAGTDPIFGYGAIRADIALAVAASVTPPTDLVVAASSIHVATGATSTQFIASDAGGNWTNLGAISYSTTQAWITAVFLTVVDAGSRRVTVQVDRTGLLDGLYTATLTLISAGGGSEAVTVTLQVQSVVPAPPFTNVYVLLYNIDTDSILSQQFQIILPSRLFTLTNIPDGSYLVFAGTDENNDDFIDDVGEYFGVLGGDEEPDIVVVQGGTLVINRNIDLFEVKNIP